MRFRDMKYIIKTVIFENGYKMINTKEERDTLECLQKIRNFCIDLIDKRKAENSKLETYP